MVKSIKDSVLFPACIRILDHRMVPIKYDVLAHDAACDVLPRGQAFNLKKIKEDVRERLQVSKKSDVIYIGEPYYMYAMREWFEVGLLPRVVVIHPDIAACVDGGSEAALRLPHLLNKYQSDDETRAWRAVNGFVIEKNVKRWFENQWPEYIKEADNNRKYREWCDHDFKIVIPPDKMCSRQLASSVDVCQLRNDGSLHRPPSKPATDIHVVASESFVKNEILIHGFIPGKQFNTYTDLSKMLPIQRLACWINCRMHGYNRDELYRCRKS